MYNANALRRYLEAGGRPEDLGLSVDDMTGTMTEPAPQGNALRQMIDQAQGNIVVGPNDYGPTGQPVPRINDMEGTVYAPPGGKTRIGITDDPQLAAQNGWTLIGQNKGPQAMQGGPMRVIGTGNGTTVEMTPEVAPAKVNLDYGQAFDIMGTKVYASKDQPGVAYAVDGSGRPTAKVYLGYNDAGTRARNKDALASRATEAQIAHTDASTESLRNPNKQITPEGTIFDPKAGTVTAAPVIASQLDRQKQKAAYDAGLKELQKDDTQVAAVSQLEQAYKRWQELQQKVMTGRLAGLADPLLAISNPERQEMIQLQSYLAVNNFKPGQGQISNFERGLIKGAGPTTSNDPETNIAITNIGLGAIQNMRDRSQFREAWLQSRGSLLGSDQAWQRYLDENPRFIRDKSGQIVPNEARQDWPSFFTNGSQARPEVAPKMASIPEAAIAFLRQNPASRADFDRKYGAGSAAKVLGR